MRTSAWRALRAASIRPCLQPCRSVAGRRLPCTKRTLYTSPSRRREDDPTETAWNRVQEQPSEIARPQELQPDAEGLLYQPDGAPDNPSRPKDRSNYGSAVRRQGRNNKRPKEIPPVHIPPWFLNRNVILNGSNTLAKFMTDNPSSEKDGQNPDQESESAEKSSRDVREEFEVGNGTLTLNEHNLAEIRSVVSAGLQVPSWQRAEVAAPLRPHPVLFCPKDGTEQMLESTARSLAAEHGTDFLSLNPQDIAEIGGDYIDENPDFRANTLSSLGYDTSLVVAARRQQAGNEGPEEDDYDETEEDQPDATPTRARNTQSSRVSGFTVIGGAALPGSIQDLFKYISPPPVPAQKGKPMFFQAAQPPKDNTLDLKLSLLAETLLNAPEIKRVAEATNKRVAAVSASGSNVSITTEPLSDSAENSSAAQSENHKPVFAESTERGNESLIVFIHDYAQINTTVNGGKFLDKLHEVVDMRRKDGQKVLIIGAVSSKDLEPSMTWSAAKEMQNHPNEGPTRTIITPLQSEPSEEPEFDLAQKERTTRINIRHIRDMLRRTAPNFDRVASVAMDWNLPIDSRTAFLSGLDESIWPMERISRVMTIALGSLENSEEMTAKHIASALSLLEMSDNAKRDWLTANKEQQKRTQMVPDASPSENSKERMRKLRKICNEHERKLFNGVVNPDDIRTTFADVQAPPQTIDALKTLTSLSLVRPDAFTYGVLATDRIPGLLLYGPPGTGKTLLAKAVAKESGATVLEVSGSDVYDMYVGEGEKNVKAIFSLAKKLTPCIVFIDEADAILGARSGGSNRTSHRELINQFLREWDGMTETSAFIMVATNRPFDLDEASLRRLPRRLLIDLPTEKDREAILKIHLKDELLHPEISLASLASQTPFYSGSDLKNLSVAAALACVREEYDTVAATIHSANSTDDDNESRKKPEYPSKRTLHKRHFDKAIEEISASISEDMGSLSAIRKFDEKYGDRKGRRKKGGYGFKTVADGEKAGSDTARVRNQT